MKRIDFHGHLGLKFLGTPATTASQVLSTLDRLKIDHFCAFTLEGFFEDPTPWNDWLAKQMAVSKGRFLPFGTVHPYAPKEQVVREARRCIEDLGLWGIKLHTWIQSAALGAVTETMVALLEEAGRLRVPVLFHDGTPPYATTRQIAEMARLAPGTTVVLGHAGLSGSVHQAVMAAREFPNLWLCFCCPKSGDLEYMVRNLGTDRIVWGSDGGFSSPLVMEERLDDVLNSSLDDAQKGRILGGNAERLLSRCRPLPD